MRRIFSNGPSKDFILNPFARLAVRSARLHLAAPYFTKADMIVEAAKAGKNIQLLVGLNSATHPDAVAAVVGLPNVSTRYLTRRFHAKIFIFDDAALLGSANLTDGGFAANREAVICLDQPEDLDAIEEIRGLFLELWDSAAVLTLDAYQSFAQAWRANQPTGPDPEKAIEDAVGRAEPANINVDSRKKTSERVFLDELQRQVYEQYRPAFAEVRDLLSELSLRRTELESIGPDDETNRFLNWVRLTHATGDESWQSAIMRDQHGRRSEIQRFGSEWASTEHSRVTPNYLDWLATVRRAFGTPEAIAAATKADLTDGLMSLHAFAEQLRFVKGGRKNFPDAFWSANRNEVERVRQILTHLLHGNGDFVPRLHDVLYDPQFKVGYFARFCALELFGTVHPDICPPLNGRTAKALRFLGFDVRAA